MGVPVSKVKPTHTSKSLTLNKVDKVITTTEIFNEVATTTTNFEGVEACAVVKCEPLKFIDDNEASDESGHFGPKETDNDNDSGNASISSGASHHEDSCNESESPKESTAPASPTTTANTNTTTLIRLRKSSSSFRFCSNLANRLSTGGFVRSESIRNSSTNVIKFDQYTFRKVIAKLAPGDLIEIQCQCTCYKGTQLRTSINQRNRFRRTLQRQSFHQLPLSGSFTSKLSSSTIGGSGTTTNTTATGLVNRLTCMSGSIGDLASNTAPSGGGNGGGESRHKILQPAVPFVSSDQQCIEQYHYVYVAKVELGKLAEEGKATDEATSSATNNTSTPLRHVWCFHVRPYQRVALLEDDRNLGIIKHETLESIVQQFMVEMEERHWQYNRTLRQPKLSIYYQIRNQDKLAETILKQTLNAKPELERMLPILAGITDSHVRYNKTTCNSEHYVTLWRYGIGWSRWVSTRAEIARTIGQFVQRFATLSTSGEDKLLVQGGECQQEATNLIVQCFGLHGSKLEEAIEQWMSAQIIIAKSSVTTGGGGALRRRSTLLLPCSSSTSTVDCLSEAELTTGRATTTTTTTCEQGDTTLATTTEEEEHAEFVHKSWNDPSEDVA